jgi:hypothetical protein
MMLVGLGFILGIKWAWDSVEDDVEDVDLLVCNYETLKNKTVSEKLLELGCEFIGCDEIQNKGW